MSKKGTFEFDCAGFKFCGNSVAKELEMKSDGKSVGVFDIDDVIELTNKLHCTLDKFEEIQDEGSFYCDQLNAKNLPLEKLIAISNDICGTNFIKRTDEFIIDFYKYGKVPMKEFISNVLDTCYNIEEVDALFDCEYISIENNKWVRGGKCLFTYNDLDDEMFVETIGKKLKEYTEDELKEFNSKYNVDIKHYNEYLKDQGYERT